MDELNGPFPKKELGSQPEVFQESLRKLDRRQWWLWSTTVLVMILLTIGVASFAFPAMLRREEEQSSFYLTQSIRSLVGLVLVFTVYLVYQQWQILRMRRQISQQVDSLSEMQTLTTEVYKLAALDQLTGLYNRRSGEQRLSEEISRSLRHGRPLTLLMMDLDGLKQVNDQLGHAGGDLFIKSFADRLQRAIRGSDLAVRLGGDEFMVVLPECRSEEVFHVLARLEGLSVTYEGQNLACHFSRGWADYRPGETAHEFMKRADDILYADKRSGKMAVSGLQPGFAPHAVI